MKNSRMIVTTLAAALIAAGSIGTAAAGYLASGDGLVTQTDLHAAREQLAWQGQGTKGAARQLYQMEEQRLDAMIGQLEHGQRVDPDDLQQSINRARHGVQQ